MCAECLPHASVQYSISMIVCEGGNLGKPSFEKLVKCLVEVYKNCFCKVVHFSPIAKIHAVLVGQEQVAEMMHPWLA